MKVLITVIIFTNLIFASAVENYLTALKIEAKKEKSTFTDFDKNRGEKIFTSKHIGKKKKGVIPLF